MTSTTSSAFDAVLATARAAAHAGDSVRARRYFRNATELDQMRVEAWLGLAATSAVLSERRACYARALALDPACGEARESIAQIDTLLAAGLLIRPRAAPDPAASPLATPRPAQPSTPTPSPVTAPRPAQPSRVPPRPRGRLGGLIVVGLIGLITMALLTSLGIFVFTSFWGLMLAFLAGPSVSELILRLTARPRRGLGGRPLLIINTLGMILGGFGAMAMGGLLLAAIGAPLPAEAVLLARRMGVGPEPALVLLNNPGLLVFVSSAVGATTFRLR